MRLECNVEVNYRTLTECLPVVKPTKERSHRSILAFSRKSENDEPYLLLQTRKNKQGTKYKIIDNVAHMFTKFINNGKATIRLQQPPHDLIVHNSNVIRLKAFLRVLSQIMKGRSQDFDYFSTTVNSKDFAKPQVKVVVKKKSEYPTLEGFPLTTEELFLTALGIRSFDRQILRLENLRVLDLSDNKLSFLPKELGTLPHLQHLVLAQNQFGKSPRFKWAWLESDAIKNNLRILDISHNFLTELPIQIGQLNALINLKACENTLLCLPGNIGTLSSLEYLDVSRNKLLCLPASVRCQSNTIHIGQIFE
ncbi:leucine-rich repeat protein 1 isoform X2 [Ooceraea biroi]|uniref:leucine-rich repeat protein 1 isoform X2 n=1 Tax=Ooceraea biroi TaxID=2015173 RepID=UPI0005BB71A4|nr:leucine-rich repeat protein 1 isoform X2 [Ooceraea biroi]